MSYRRALRYERVPVYGQRGGAGAAKVVLQSIALLAVALVMGCKTEPDRVKEESKTLAKESVEAYSDSAGYSGSTLDDSHSAAAPTPAFVIDASRSMVGFVDGDHDSEFSRVLDRLTTSMGVQQAWKFGQAARGSGDLMEMRPLDRSVHRPSFYDRLQNPDHELFALAVSDSTDRPYVYVTDGVQSAERGENQAAALNHLREHLQEGGALAILAFKSQFSGRGWSEQQQQWIGDVDVADRPFYAIITASSTADMNALMSMMPPDLLEAATVMTFGGELIRCTTSPADLPKVSESSDRSWFMLELSAAASASPEAVTLGTLECEIPTGLPLVTVRAEVSSLYRPWDHAEGRFGGPEPSPSTFSVGAPSARSGGSSAPITALLRDVPQTGYGYYELRFAAEAGDIASAVEELSSESDDEAEDFRRTYRLKWLVEPLVREAAARAELPPPLAFTVQHP